MQTSAQQKLKILFVGISGEDRALLADILSRQYDIEEAGSGEQAIFLMLREKDRYSMVLLNLIMPRMDGYEFMNLLNQYHLSQSIPVIMVSAEPTLDHIKRAYSYGVSDFIRPPYEAGPILDRTQKIIARFRGEEIPAEQPEPSVQEKSDIPDLHKTASADLIKLVHACLAEFQSRDENTYNPVLQKRIESLDSELRRTAEKAGQKVVKEVDSDANTGHPQSSGLSPLEEVSIIDQTKTEFLFEQMDVPCFYLQCDPPVLYMSNQATKWFGIKTEIPNPAENQELLKFFRPEEFRMIRASILDVPPGEYKLKIVLLVRGKSIPCELCCKSVTVTENRILRGVIGTVTRDN